MRLRLLLVVVPLLLVFAAPPCEAQIFVFELTGAQEVPPQPSPARGGCFAELDQPAGELTIYCSHDLSTATTVHVHRAPAGANGPVAFDMGVPSSPIVATWSGMTEADVADVLAGNLYVNVHSAGRPDGEIRGQIVERTVDTVAFSADAGQVVPPTVSPATASCVADLNAAATAVAVDCTHDVAAPTEAHLHAAPAGETGPVVFTFADAASPISGVAPLTPAEVADFAAGFLYVEIHSTDVPSGEIRGQVAEPLASPTAGTIRIRKRSDSIAAFGFTDDVPGSPGSFTLFDGDTHTFLSVPPGTYTVTEDDPAAAPIPSVLVDVACTDGDSTGDVFRRAATIRLAAGEVVTCVFENAELVAADTTFVFHLDGEQEVPPQASPSSGGCMGLFDADAARLMLVCSHDVIGAALMHVHRAPAGQNGPVVFDLGDPASPVTATWNGMSPGEVADLLAGNLYVNIHTSGRPAGEIRGQILPRTVDSFAFPLSGAQQVPPVFTTAGGRCTADLSDAADALLLDCVHDVVGATVAHVHDAPAGQNGPVVFEFGDGSSPFAGTIPMTPRTVAELAAGFLYVNVHSEEVPDGEIRGQIVNAPVSVLEVPSLGTWGLLLLALALAGLGVRRLGL